MSLAVSKWAPHVFNELTCRDKNAKKKNLQP